MVRTSRLLWCTFYWLISHHVSFVFHAIMFETFILSDLPSIHLYGTRRDISSYKCWWFCSRFILFSFLSLSFSYFELTYSLCYYQTTLNQILCQLLRHVETWRTRRPSVKWYLASKYLSKCIEIHPFCPCFSFSVPHIQTPLSPTSVILLNMATQIDKFTAIPPLLPFNLFVSSLKPCYGDHVFSVTYSSSIWSCFCKPLIATTFSFNLCHHSLLVLYSLLLL